MRRPPVTEILLIRHAQSEWNASRRWQGHADPPLSALGREQAVALAERLSGERVDALYSSDLARAMETARPIAAGHHLSPETFSALRELHIGCWEGLTRTQIKQRWADALREFDTEDPDARPTEGETRRELEGRVRDCVAKLVARHPGGRIAIVAHMGVIAALLPDTRLDNAAFRRSSSREVC